MDSSADDESLLFNLVYCSRAVAALEPHDLDRLVAAAQRRNAQESITGWLVYSHGIFVQWLEGARANVERVMASISADARHSAIVVLSQAEEVRERMFADWDMELVSAADIRAVLSDAIEASSDVNTKVELRDLLQELDSRSL